MNPQKFLNSDWPLVLSFLPDNLDDTAKQFGALLRKRKVKDAQTLLRLGLAYSFGGFSLRDTSAWAQAAEITDFSDVALLKRLRQSADWFGYLVAQKLAQRTQHMATIPRKGHIRLLDATTANRPGSTGTDWRLHVGFDLERLLIDHIELTDAQGGETFTRFPAKPDDIVVGDAGYAHRAGIVALNKAGAQVIVRLNWQNVPLQSLEAKSFQLFEALRSLKDTEAGDFAVQTAPDDKAALPAVVGRLVAIRKSEEAAERARARVKKQARKKGHTPDPRTLEAAGYIFLFTTLPAEEMSAVSILELYRFRWQIEIAFKEMKSLLFLDEMLAKDEALCRSYLLLKVLAMLLIEDLRSRWASFSPWGYASPAPSLPVAPLRCFSTDASGGVGAGSSLAAMGSPLTTQSSTILRHAA